MAQHVCAGTVSRGLQCRDSSVTKIFTKWSGLQFLGNSGVYIFTACVCIFIFCIERERETIDIYIYCLRRTPNKQTHFTQNVVCFSQL